jgi:nifR3 family TIM-barrel protein
VSAEGLTSAGREALLPDLEYSERERPIAAQIFGGKPEKMRETAKLIAELGFDGIDINMGCPDNGVEKSGAGASLIKDPERAKEIILQTMEGAGDLPVSVKTRLGYAKSEIETWLPHILNTGVSAITIHARTRNELSLVPAKWEEVRRAVEIRDALDSSPLKPLLLGNGDVMSLDEADERIKETGADGVMIGRGIFGNPWCFRRGYVPSVEEKLRVMVEHTKLFEEILPSKNFAIMKKHYKAYANGFDNAKELRMELMEAKDANHVAAIVEAFLSKI